MKLADELQVPHLRNKRRNFLVNFKIKDMAHLNKILEGRPISIASVRHPFERLVSAYLDRDNVETGKRLKGNLLNNF